MEENKLNPDQEKQYLDCLQRSEDWTVMADKLRDAMGLNGFE